MSMKDIAEAKDPDLRASVVAMHRAAELARETAIRTDTDPIVVKNGQLVRISAQALREARAATKKTAWPGISRFISNAKAEPEIDLEATHRQLVEIGKTIRAATQRHNVFLRELNLPALPGGEAGE